MITHYLMVLVVSFASSAIVAKHAIQKVMSKIEGEFLFLIQFTKDQKVAVKKSKLVIEAMVKMLEPLTKHTVTPDRGKEFTYHQDLADKLKGEAYFPDPHAPWQRGTNENANGLLREYFPTGSDLTLVDDQTIQLWENKLNNRPRKCLNWKTPYEVFYKENVHLI